jgi:hypothetical protein
MYYCHCSDCRKSGGNAFHTGLYMKRAAFSLTGKVHSFALKADSGRTIHRYFCPNCASQLYADKGADTEMLSVKAGTLDDPALFEPDTEIWSQSKVKWADLPENLDRHEKGYGE